MTIRFKTYLVLQSGDEHVALLNTFINDYVERIDIQPIDVRLRWYENMIKIVEDPELQQNLKTDYYRLKESLYEGYTHIVQLTLSSENSIVFPAIVKDAEGFILSLDTLLKKEDRECDLVRINVYNPANELTKVDVKCERNSKENKNALISFV